MTYPSLRAAWGLTILLTLAYVFSFVDRYILGLLVEPIKADLHLTDEQMGLLIGLAFGIFYATIGVPLGWLADRVRRTRLVAAGVAVWSLATAASGMATSFAGLFAARMTVGIGEATLSPSALSLIADSFPPEKRGRPVGVYSTGLSLGAGVASLIGAAALTWAKTSTGLTLPLLGEVRPWQFVFLIVGTPGLLIALGFLFMPEPPRQRTAADPVAATIAQTIAHVGQYAGAFIGLVSLICVMTTIAYSQGFLPSAFARTYGWEARQYAAVNGTLSLIVGPLTVIATGILNDRFRKSGNREAGFRLLTISYVLMIAACSVALLMPSPWLALGVLALGSMGIAGVTASGIIALLEITPGTMRGTIVALYYMAISISGLMLGPTTVGVLSTRVYGEAHLREAVATVPMLYGLIPLLLIPVIRRAYLKRLVAAS